MASPNPVVKIHKVTRVTPCSNSSNSLSEFSLPLTFFDTFWFKFHPVERVFFYQHTESSPHFFDSVILPKLKRSLSLTLLHYLPLAGRLTWASHTPKPAIVYAQGDAVSLTIAESDSNFNRLSGHEILEAIELHSLIPQLQISDDMTSIIALQITLFPYQGFSIGITAHHTILDGKTTIMFMKSWAHLCKQDQNQDPSLLPELIPFFDRTIIKDPTGLDMLYLNQWLVMTRSDSDPNSRSLKPMLAGEPSLDLVRATFELTRQDIKKLREWICSNLIKESKPLHLSTFVLTFAYVLACIVKAKGIESNKKVYVGFVADCRTRLNPPIPVNYFGNCVFSCDLSLEARAIMEENGVAIVAEKISDVIREMETKGVLEGAETKISKWMNLELGEMMIPIGVAGSTRFEVYGTDFGWGRPKKVEIVSIDKSGAISMAESRDGSGGVEVGLALKKHEMKDFSSLFVNGLKCL